MIILNNKNEYVEWILCKGFFALDILDNEEINDLILEMAPPDYPCIVVCADTTDISGTDPYRVNYVTKSDVIVWGMSLEYIKYTLCISVYRGVSLRYSASSL